MINPSWTGSQANAMIAVTINEIAGAADEARLLGGRLTQSVVMRGRRLVGS